MLTKGSSESLVPLEWVGLGCPVPGLGSSGEAVFIPELFQPLPCSTSDEGWDWHQEPRNMDLETQRGPETPP